MKIREKVTLMWRILKAKRKIIVFDPDGIYSNAVLISKDALAEKPEWHREQARRLLKDNMDHIIPPFYQACGKFEFLETKQAITGNAYVSIRFTPPHLICRPRLKRSLFKRLLFGIVK